MRIRLNTLQVPVAMEVIGEHLEEQARMSEALGRGLDGVRLAVEDLSKRVGEHDKRKARWDKFTMTVATGLAIAMIAGLYRLAMIVQASRLPGV